MPGRFGATFRRNLLFPAFMLKLYQTTWLDIPEDSHICILLCFLLQLPNDQANRVRLGKALSWHRSVVFDLVCMCMCSLASVLMRMRERERDVQIHSKYIELAG
jgi:hypothetical protein